MTSDHTSYEDLASQRHGSDQISAALVGVQRSDQISAALDADLIVEIALHPAGGRPTEAGC